MVECSTSFPSTFLTMKNDNKDVWEAGRKLAVIEYEKNVCVY